MEQGRVGRVLLVGAVLGLDEEGGRVRRVLESEGWDVVHVGISLEELASLERSIDSGTIPLPKEEWTETDLVYGEALSAFGSVSLPPAAFVEAIRVAREKGAPIVPTDLTSEEYDEAFTKNVSTWALLLYSRRVRKLRKKPPQASSPEELARAWDLSLRRVRGWARVESLREETIAHRAHEASKRGRVALVVDLARFEGIRRILEKRTNGI